MMREVFLDELPRYENVMNRCKINWGKCIGFRVRFIYDDIKGIIEIVNYDKKTQLVTIRYGKVELNIKTGHLINSKLGRLIGKYTNEFKVNIGEVFKDYKRNLLIIDRSHQEDNTYKKWKTYRYKCNVCQYDGYIREYDLLKGKGCSCCTGKTIVEGINDITTIAPWMIDLGVDKEEAKMFTCQSNKKIKCCCPNCGEIKYKSINQIYKNKSIGCPCGDNISYPEKFMHSILKQLGLEFQTQLTKTTFEWCDKYKYDFYIPSLKMIIETHGMQHYKESFSRCGGKGLKEEKENDRAKRGLVFKNGITNYVELDCRYSELNWVKGSILNSKLNELFDLTQIDWFKCEEYAINSNKVKEVCDYWNNKEEWETTKDLANVLGIGINAITSYLKRGNLLGWCSYNSKDESKKGRSRAGKANAKKIEVFDRKGISLGVFIGGCELSKLSEDVLGIKISNASISAVCLGKLKQCKEFTFQYI